MKKGDPGQDTAVFMTVVLHNTPVLQPPSSQQLSWTDVALWEWGWGWGRAGDLATTA